MGEKFSIGHALRKQREERGLTPEQAAYQSKVPLRLLQALEADDYRLLPDPAYLIGLLHEYTLLLKLDPKALETEFRSAIRRPPGGFPAPIPLQPAPTPIPWKHVLWTAVAILVVTPAVFIALSLASKRAADRPAPPQEERAPVEAAGPAVQPESLQPEVTAGPGEVPAVLQTGLPSGGATQETPTPTAPSPQTERKPRRFLLTARAAELTWMAVRADDGQERRVLLQRGQVAHFVADTRFVVTVGNAGGVELLLNGRPMPSLGRSGQVIRDLVLPPVVGGAEAVGTSSSGAASGR